MIHPKKLHLFIFISVTPLSVRLIYSYKLYVRICDKKLGNLDLSPQSSAKGLSMLWEQQSSSCLRLLLQIGL